MEQPDSNNTRQLPENGSDNVQPDALDQNLVYFVNNEVDRGFQKKPLLVIAIAALTVIAAAIAIFVAFMPRNTPKTPAIATFDEPVVTTNAPTAVTPAVTETAPPPTTTAPAPTTTAPPTTAAPTAAPTQAQSDESKLIAYARSSGILETLQAEAYNNMTVVVSAENNMLIARFEVKEDSMDAAQAEYFESLPSYFDSLCTQLDKYVYDMRTQTGVNNAVLEVVGVDRNNMLLYDNIID